MNMPYDERVAWNKARRKNKRRLIALAKNKGEGPESAESPENGSE
jgi:hypothetical protein